MKIKEYYFPDNLYYMLREPGHTWMEVLDNILKIGVDDYVSKRAGEIEFVRIMPIGKRVKKDQIVGTYESGKWIGQIKAPIAGKIVLKNDKLSKNPSLINSDPYGDGWILQIETENIAELIEEDEEIVKSGEKLEHYIRWRIQQE